MKERVFWLIMLVLGVLSVPALLPGQVKPNNFPLEPNPNNSNFEVYSQKDNQNKKATLDALKKYLAPFIKTVGYVPSASGNTSNLTDVVQAPNGNVYYIDGTGKATQIFGTQAIHTDGTTITGSGTPGSPLSIVGTLTDNQTLSTTSSGSNRNIAIQRGNSISFSINDADSDPTNEIQVLSKSGSTVTLSKSGGSFTDEVDDDDADPENELQELSFNESNDSLEISGKNKVWLGDLRDEDGDPENELQELSFNETNDSLEISGKNKVWLGDLRQDEQTLSIAGNQLSISGGNTVTVPSGADNWGTQAVVTGSGLTGNGTIASPLSVNGDLTDDQTLSISGNVLSISGGNSVTLNPNDADFNPQNEIQYLSLNGNVLSITQGNYVTLPAATGGEGGADNWGSQVVAADSTLIGTGITGDTLRVNLDLVQLQPQGLLIAGNQLSIERGNTITLPPGADNWGTQVVSIGAGLNGNGTAGSPLFAVDASATNEAQTLTKSGSTISLSAVSGSGGGSVTDSDAQTLSISGSNLTISGGNTVTIPTGTGGDNWGSQTVVTGGGLGGNGTAGSPLYAMDPSATNEAQTISKSGNTVTLTNVGGIGGGTFTVDDADASATNEAQTLTKSGSTISLSAVSGSGGGSVTDSDAQTLSISGSNLTISGGNTVTIPAATGDNWGSQTVVTGGGLGGNGTAGSPLYAMDPSATNEAQTISKSGNTVTLTNVGGIGGGTFTVDDADASATNEAQTLTKSGSTISLSAVSGSGGGSVTDSDAQTLSISGSNLTISGGNTVTIPAATGDNWGSQTVVTGGGLGGNGTAGSPLYATDPSATNEAQTLSKVGSTISLTAVSGSGGGSVTDSDGQTLSVSGNQLSISGGNTINLPVSAGDNWGTQVVEKTGRSLSGSGTAVSPLQIAGSLTRAHYNLGQTISGTNPTKGIIGTVNINSLMITANVNEGFYNFTINTGYSGYYRFTFTFVVEKQSSGDGKMYFNIYKNNNGVFPDAKRQTFNYDYNASNMVHLEDIIFCGVGDVIDVRFFTDAGQSAEIHELTTLIEAAY